MARVVEELGKQTQATQEIEVKLGQHLIRAYELPTQVARTDTTSFSVNHQQGDSPQESLLRSLLGSLFPKPRSIYYPWSTATHLDCKNGSG
ncbi:hypothetical protein LC609_27385 [Nostoc sp. XA013]|nr:hypothetical protein [Nostoc sp. XA013]